MASPLKHPGATVSRKSKAHVAAVVDPLERRALLSATLLPDGTLQVTGTDGPDQVTLRRGTEANKLSVQEGTTTLFVFLLDQVKSINVALGLGDDTLNVDTTPGLITSATGDLPIRVLAGLRTDGLDEAIGRGLRSGSEVGERGDGFVRLGWLKLFADGTLASQTAALLLAREGSDDRGMFRTPPEELADRARRAAAGGIATKIHAIGDAAVRASLDALGPTAGDVPFMPRLEHIQLCHPDDRPRFAALGVAASVQPVHIREDAATARRDWGDRAEAWGYTFRSLIDAGAVVAFGTDAPVEPPDPWPGIALAVLRRDPSWGPDAEPFGPHEAVTLGQALRAATVGPALTARDPLGGRLVPGAAADLIVLPAAPREPDAQAAAFASVRPRLVLVGGQPAIDR